VALLFRLRTHVFKHIYTQRTSTGWWRRRAAGVVGGACALLLLAAAVPVLTLVHRGQRDLVRTLRGAPAMHLSARTLHAEEPYTLHEIVLEDGSGSVRATLRVPRGEPRAAALIIVGGFRTGRAAIDLVDDALPLAVAAMDYACDIPRSVGAWDVLRFPKLQRDLERTAVALRDLVAHVRADPRIDPERVFIVGASLGAPFASAVAAAVSPAGLVLMHGFANHAALVEHRLAQSWPSETARRAVARLAALLTDAFDARRTLPHLRDVPVLIVEAHEDEMVPRDCRIALWNATPEPRQRVSLPGGHLRGGRRSDPLQAAMLQTRDWLAQRGVPELAL